jgi:hypothetical protein
VGRADAAGQGAVAGSGPAGRALAELGQGLASSVFSLSNVPADDSAGMPDGGSGDAAASDYCPTGAASQADLRDHSVRLMKRREGHGLRRCCEGQRKGNSD